MIERMRRVGAPVEVCTIYKDTPGLPEEETSALALFNEVITDEAVRAGFRMIDIRQIRSDPADYSAASPIEPSHSGGRKIAKAILATIDCRC